MLLQNIEDLKTLPSTRIPVFDFEKNVRSGSKELTVTEDCGVVSLKPCCTLVFDCVLQFVSDGGNPSSILSPKSCDLFSNLDGVTDGVDASGHFGRGVRVASQHSTIPESLGGCGNDEFFC